MDLRVSNFDAQEAFKAGIASVTVPTSELTYPVEPIKFSSGIASISGTSTYPPVVSQVLLDAKIKIARASDNFEWDGSAYVDPGQRRAME